MERGKKSSSDNFSSAVTAIIVRYAAVRITAPNVGRRWMEETKMVEKFFIVENEDFLRLAAFVKEARETRNKFLCDFFEKHQIEGEYYRMHGNGSYHCAFSEELKLSIVLEIEGTAGNRERFGNQLRKNSLSNGLYAFKKSAPVLKAFQDACVEHGIIINLDEYFVGDFFEELHFGGYSSKYFEHAGTLYLSIHTTRSNTLTPKDGFIEVKPSEFYAALEAFQEQGGRHEEDL